MDDGLVLLDNSTALLGTFEVGVRVALKYYGEPLCCFAVASIFLSLVNSKNHVLRVRVEGCFSSVGES